MADSSFQGIFSLNDVRIRQNKNVWPGGDPAITATYLGNRAYQFILDTQLSYTNQFVYYVLNQVDSSNTISATDFEDNSIAGQVYLGPDGIMNITKKVLINNKKKFTIQLRTGSISGANLVTTPTVEIGVGDVPVELLVVGGGGGGGMAGGGGAGGGGVVNTTAIFRFYSSYTITVGYGGVGGGFGSQSVTGIGQRGGSSTVFPHAANAVIAYGGGGGGVWNVSDSANSYGASGGGAGVAGGGQGPGPAGIGVYPGSIYISATRQGYDGNGGVSNDSNNGGGAGGGAGGAGTNGVAGLGGTGGPGLQYSTSGTAVYYGAGGGGGGRNTGGSGGTNTGGAGVGGTSNGANATIFTGSGGGGGGGGYPSPTPGNGGYGASGVVIIKYPSNYPAAVIATGSPDVTISGGYRIYRFWQSGTFALADTSTL